MYILKESALILKVISTFCIANTVSYKFFLTFAEYSQSTSWLHFSGFSVVVVVFVFISFAIYVCMSFDHQLTEIVFLTKPYCV